MPSIVGCDVSKKILDVTIYPDTYKQFENTEQGRQEMLLFLPVNSLVCVESTSTYYKPLAVFLKNNGHIMYVANPLTIKRYAQSRLRKLKTDKADSYIIAEYLLKMHHDLTPWSASSFNQTTCSYLVKTAEALTVQQGSQANRSKAFSFAYPEIEQTIESARTKIKAEQNHFYTLARKIIIRDDTLSQWYKALLKLPGFGEVLAVRFLGHCSDLNRFKTGRHFASFCGITPSDHQSGGVTKQAHISRMGSPKLRAILFLAARAASKSKSRFGDMYKRLISQNKSKYRAYTALGNRLARAAWAVCVKPQDEK